MSLNDDTKPEFVALLSAASLTAGLGPDINGIALRYIAGEPILGRQMQALLRFGISAFLIEVDNVPGELLNLADSFRLRGVQVEFVRSAKDFQSALKSAERVVVQAEGHYFSDAILNELMSKGMPFVATIDSRDENNGFERIDLNTRWSGFAILNAVTAKSMIELPEGWSISSSLLRHALQNDVRFEALVQARLQCGEVVRISTQTDAEGIIFRMLAERAARPRGFIERYVFGNIARRIAPAIWAKRQGALVVGMSSMILAVGSIGLSMLGLSTAAAGAALLAVFLHTVFGVVRGFDTDGSEGRWQSLLFWGTLSLSAFVAAWTNADYGSDTMSFVTILLGLALLPKKMTLPRWSDGLLQSPAILTTVILIASAFSVFAQGMKVIVLAQLFILTAGLYLSSPWARNADHA